MSFRVLAFAVFEIAREREKNLLLPQLNAFRVGGLGALALSSELSLCSEVQRRTGSCLWTRWVIIEQSPGVF